MTSGDVSGNRTLDYLYLTVCSQMNGFTFKGSNYVILICLSFQRSQSLKKRDSSPRSKFSLIGIDHISERSGKPTKSHKNIPVCKKYQEYIAVSKGWRGEGGGSTSRSLAYNK